MGFICLALNLNQWQTAPTILTTCPKQRVMAITYQVFMMSQTLYRGFFMNELIEPSKDSMRHTLQIIRGETEARKIQYLPAVTELVSGRNPRKTKEGWLWNPNAQLLSYADIQTGQMHSLVRTFPVPWPLPSSVLASQVYLTIGTCTLHA